MEALLRKYLWALDLFVVALVAVFFARATGVMIGSSLVRRMPPPARALRLAVPAASRTTVYAKDVTAILRRNIFCSTCPPLVDIPVSATDAIDKDAAPQRTSLPLKLMAVMYAPPPSDPRWSMAILRDTESGAAGPYGVGDTIRGAKLVDVQETRIYLDNAGKPEFLDLMDVPPPPPGAAPPKPDATPADPLAAEMDKGVKKTGENSYEVQKSTIDALLGNMGALSRAARIVPEVKDGKSTGFRLFSIRPDGPFAKIGLQNGDVITAINGLEMNSPDKALEVYTKLRTASHLSVSLERNGQKVTKDYSIR